MAPRKNQTQRQFLWVNKDSDSRQLSRSQGQEARSILRFVQRNRTNVRHRPRRTSRQAGHDFIAFKTEARISTQEIPRWPPEEQNASRNRAQTSVIIRSMQTRWQVNVPVDNNLVEWSGVDPFKSTVVPITSEMFSLLQYTQHSISIGAGGYKLEAFPGHLRPFTDLYQAAVKYSFQNMVRFKYIMYPMLATFSLHLYQLNNSPFSRSQNPDWYFQLAVQAVRNAIQVHINDKDALKYIATGVHFLICAAALGKRIEESQMHIRAFLKFLPYINTQTMVGSWDIDTASSLDIVTAAATGKRPIIKMPISDPGPMASTRKAAMTEKLREVKRGLTAPSSEPESLSSKPAITQYQESVIKNKFDMLQHPKEDLTVNLGSALESSLDTNQIHPQLAHATRKLFDCLDVAKVVWHAPDFATKQDTTWLCKRSRAMLHELLSLAGSKAIDTRAFAGQQNECLRLTLIIVVMSTLYRVLLIPRIQQVERLRAALMPIIDVNWGISYETKETTYDPNEMLLWMLMTGYWAAQDSAEAPWFAVNAVIVARDRLHITSYEDLHKLMTRYLYSKTVQRQSLNEIIELF